MIKHVTVSCYPPSFKYILLPWLQTKGCRNYVLNIFLHCFQTYERQFILKENEVKYEQEHAYRGANM